MRITTTLSALVLGLAAAGLAQAAETAPELTRAQVVQQLQQAEAQGAVTAGHDPYFPMIAAQNTETRAQVEQQLRDAESRGLVTAGHDPYYPQLATQSTKSRAQVLAELHSVESKGMLPQGHEPYYPSANDAA